MRVCVRACLRCICMYDLPYLIIQYDRTIMKIMYLLSRHPKLRSRVGFTERRTCLAHKLNGCGKLQIFILSGKKFENSQMHVLRNMTKLLCLHAVN